MKKSLQEQKKQTVVFIQQMFVAIVLGSGSIIGLLYIMEHHEKYLNNYFLIVFSLCIFAMLYYVSTNFKYNKDMIATQVQYVPFAELREEAQENVLNDTETRKYLARLRKIKPEAVTEKHIMAHIELNNFVFSPDGRGKRRKVTA